MTDPAIAEVAQQLEETLTKLRATKDPDLRRTVLTEIRILMSQLDRLVIKSAESYSARPDSK
jgi:hypothetical protein